MIIPRKHCVSRQRHVISGRDKSWRQGELPDCPHTVTSLLPRSCQDSILLSATLDIKDTLTFFSVWMAEVCWRLSNVSQTDKHWVLTKHLGGTNRTRLVFPNHSQADCWAEYKAPITRLMMYGSQCQVNMTSPAHIPTGAHELEFSPIKTFVSVQWT